MRKYSLLFVVAAILFAAGCTSPTDENKDNNGTGIVLSINAVPQIIAANGISEAVIFVEVQRDGAYVPDSTQVLFFQTLGRLKDGRAFTYQGVALDTLVSDTTAGTSAVIAYLEGQRDTVAVIFAAP